MCKRVIEQDIRPLSEFRFGVASFVKQVHDTKWPLIITQPGKGVGEFEAMQARIELLEDIQASVLQLEAGKGLEHKEAQKEVLARLEQ